MKWFESGKGDTNIPSGAPRRMPRAVTPPAQAQAKTQAIVQQLRSMGGPQRAQGQSVKWAK